jgi:hypothetical protein
MERRRVTAMATTKSWRHILRVAIPGGAERNGGVGIAAVLVVEAAYEEICPLRDVLGACDAAGVGAEVVGLSEGRRIGDAGED